MKKVFVVFTVLLVFCSMVLANTHTSILPAGVTPLDTVAELQNVTNQILAAKADGEVPSTAVDSRYAEQAPDPRGSRDHLDQGADVCPATVIPSLPYTDTGTTSSAQANYGTVCSAASPDVIYSYTSSSYQTVTVSLCGSSFDTCVEIRVGGACPGSTVVAFNGDYCGWESLATFNALPNTTYYFLVKGQWPVSGAYVLNVTSTPNGPTNDSCPGTTITSLPYMDTGNTSTAHADYGTVCSAASPDVIYNFTPSCSQTVTVSLCGSSFDTCVEIRVGGACPGSTVVAFNGDYCGWESEVTFNALPNVTYYFLVKGQWPVSGAYVLNVTGTACPPGEICATALPLSVPSTVTGNTCGFNDNMTCGDGSGGRDVVYTYSPTTAQQVTFSLCNGNTNFDTKLAVFSGNCAGTPIACNDDYCGLISRLECVALTGGATYYVVVDGWGSYSCGNYTLTATECVPPPPGDICATALPLTVPDTVTGNTCGYQDDLNADCSAQSTGGKDVVYAYTPTANQYVDFNLCNGNTNFDSKLYIFAGNCTGTPIACNDDYCANPPYFANPYISHLTCMLLTGGTTYYVVVDGFTSTTCGDYTLTAAECVPSPPPPNDNCAAASPITVNGSQVCATNNGATRDCSQLSIPEVWYFFNLTRSANLVVSYCGTQAGSGSILGNLFGGSCCGNPISYSSYEYTTCADGRISFHFNSLAAGTYWLPVGITPSRDFCIQLTSAPDSLVARRANNGQDIELNWSSAGGSTEYHIYRGAAQNFEPLPANLIGTSESTSYVDTGVLLRPDIHNFYIVKAAPPTGLSATTSERRGDGDDVAREAISRLAPAATR